ncbi:type II secretion system F family protein [Arthrobacter sp. NamB2]|uniref:type II secretion system F family protein n=1 Tax=Arthrobacter sp. NamB2 TaxID=2576035 RepID=UPI0010C93DC0|nr:type II secretion system F family protein [Arthrobacter sp. NamB2]TKV29505.1 type II secretion system F family protein [Arthrobacter sp. NamB2]
MDLILLASLLLTSVPIGYFSWALLTSDTKVRRLVRNNLNQGIGAAGASAERRNHLLRLGRRLTTQAYVLKLDHLLALAGRPAAMPLEKVLTAKPLLGLAGGLAGLLLVQSRPDKLFVLLALFITLLGYFVPDLLLYSKGQERQKAMALELANTLDQMLISVEAGLGFESAMQRAGETGKGPLAEELVRTLQDMQVGRSRREAYLAMADRSNVPELRSFVKAIVQADAYGIALSGVLRTQAKVMRVKRRQRAEEKAMKLPVAVLFPLLLFIFPVLFIVILGPAVLNVIDTFAGQ